MPKIRTISAVPKQQADAELNQAAPVQNTWYEVLTTTANVRIQLINFYVDVADETLEIKITIDGVALTGSVAATAGTYYNAGIRSTGGANLLLTSSSDFSSRAFMIEGRSVKVEMRKTTAAGANPIHAFVTYSKW